MANDLNDLDETQPIGSVIKVKQLDDFIRESRAHIKGWASHDHDYNGSHAFRAGTTTERASVNPTIGEGGFWLNTDFGGVRLDVFFGTIWQHLGPPTGTIAMWPGTVPPPGWFLCDGAAISRATYGELFAVCGLSYGVGDGVNTFNLPSLKGRVPAGFDVGQAEFDNLGETGGEKTHALSTAELAAHGHGINDPTHNHTVNDPTHAHGFAPGTIIKPLGGGASGGTGTGLTTDTPVVQAAASGVTNQAASTGITTQNNGSGTAHNNLQPYLTLNFIIKA